MADTEFAHLPADVRPLAQLDAEVRIAHIRAGRWIQHAAAARLLGYLQEAFDQPPRERMENLLLLGESGMGKTMLIRKFERQNAVSFDEAAGVQRRPVVVMLMPPQPTEVEFFNRVLEAINAATHGDALFTTGVGQHQMWRRSTPLQQGIGPAVDSCVRRQSGCCARSVHACW